MYLIFNRVKFGINLHFLLLRGSKIGIRILFDPLLAVERDLLNDLLVISLDMREEVQVLEHVLNPDAVLLQLEPRLPIQSDLLIVLLVAYCLLNHSSSLLFKYLFFDIFNLYGSRATRFIFDYFDSQNAVFIDEEVDFDLRDSCLGRRDPRHRELAN
jgi:hypothetical protein